MLIGSLSSISVAATATSDNRLVTLATTTENSSPGSNSLIEINQQARLEPTLAPIVFSLRQIFTNLSDDNPSGSEAELEKQFDHPIKSTNYRSKSLQANHLGQNSYKLAENNSFAQLEQ